MTYPLTDPFRPKRALYDALVAATATGQPLEGVQVEYSPPAQMRARCVYLGGVRFEHEDTAQGAPGQLVNETASIGVYVRVLASPPIAAIDNETAAAALGAAVLAVAKTVPTAGQWFGVGRSVGLNPQSGIGSTTRSDNETITLVGYNVQLGQVVRY